MTVPGVDKITKRGRLGSSGGSSGEPRLEANENRGRQQCTSHPTSLPHLFSPVCQLCGATNVEERYFRKKHEKYLSSRSVRGASGTAGAGRQRPGRQGHRSRSTGSALGEFPLFLLLFGGDDSGFLRGGGSLVYFGNCALPDPPHKSLEVLGHPRPYLLFTGPERPWRLLWPLSWVAAASWLLEVNPQRKQKKKETAGACPPRRCPRGRGASPRVRRGDPLATGAASPAVSVEWAE